VAAAGRYDEIVAAIDDTDYRPDCYVERTGSDYVNWLANHDRRELR
jgi:hypothetical protein